MDRFYLFYPARDYGCSFIVTVEVTKKELDLVCAAYKQYNYEICKYTLGEIENDTYVNVVAEKNDIRIGIGYITTTTLS